MKTFAIGDVHGQLDTLKRLIERIPFRPEVDTLVFMGDLVDRGPDSRGVIDYVRKLQQDSPKVIALRGNHEQVMLDALSDRRSFLMWMFMGGEATYRNYCDGFEPSWDRYKTSLPEDTIRYLESLPLTYNNDHALFVHAGARRGEDGVWSVDSPHTALWYRAEEFWRSYEGRQIVVGHTPTNKIRRMLGEQTPPEPQMCAWVRGSITAIDCGAGSGYRLCAVQLPEQSFFYESVSRNV